MENTSGIHRALPGPLPLPPTDALGEEHGMEEGDGVTPL